MKTSEEIVKAVECCFSNRNMCNQCPYHELHSFVTDDCIMALKADIVICILQLEEQNSLMKVQMRGDCGVCRHRDSNGEPCASCMMGAGSHPNWEYEGLPELAVK